MPAVFKADNKGYDDLAFTMKIEADSIERDSRDGVLAQTSYIVRIH